MRALVALPMLLVLALPAPAAAQTAPTAPAPESATTFAIPSELTDPAMAETLARVLGSMTRVMMDVPVGEMQAAVEGRQPTLADKRRTIRDLTGGRDFDRNVERQVAVAMPRMQAAMKAMAASLPAMAKALEKAAEGMEAEIDRAAANMPQPGYPKQ